MQFTTSALLLFTLLPLGLAAPAATSASASASKAAGKATGASSSAAKSTGATASASAAKASAGADASGASSSGNTTASTGGTSTSGAANGISDIQVGNAVMSWMNDTAKVTKFLNTAASLSGDDFTKQATIALNAEKDELNHKKVLDDAFSSMPSVMSANDVLATQGTFQKVVDALAQMVSDGPDTAQSMVDAINANRCVNVLPNIDAYFAAAGSASVMSARPTGCLEVANAVASPAAAGASGNASTGATGASGASGASGAGAAGAASGASSSASSSVTSAASKATGAASKATGSASKATGAAAKATGAAANAASKSTGAAKAAAKATAA